MKKKLLSILLATVFIVSMTTIAFAGEYKLGDTNLDGKVTILDAKWVLLDVANKKNLTDEQKEYADVTKDGDISILDAKWILQAVANMRELEDNTTEPEPQPEPEPPVDDFPYLDPNELWPTESQTAYFTASTGEEIEIYTFRSLDDSFCTKVYEEDGEIVALYTHGGSENWVKCPDCGLYLCDGDCVDHSYCEYCGYPVDKCHRYIIDTNCYYCGEPVKANTCHHCYE